MSRITNYIKDTKTELTHVSWPSNKHAIVSTALVIAISIVIALVTGALDRIFTTALDLFIR